MRSLAIAIALTVSVLAVEAVAQDRSERDKAVHDCFQTPAEQADILIAGCTKLIALGANLNSSSYSEILVNMGMARWNKGDLQKAEEDFESAVRMNPRLLPAYVDRASLNIVLGKAEDSLPDLNHVLAEKPKDPAVLSIICLARGALNRELEQALSDCDQSLKTRPRNAKTLGNRALVLYRQGKFQQALESLDESLNINPNSALHLTLRGYTKKKLGDVTTGDADIAAAKLKDSEAGSLYRSYGISEN